jgi:uncharacterized protein
MRRPDAWKVPTDRVAGGHEGSAPSTRCQGRARAQAASPGSGRREDGLGGAGYAPPVPLTPTVHETWRTVDAAAWDALVGDGSPFLEHAFLSGLEATGCATLETGWAPRPVTVETPGGQMVGGAPAWEVRGSRGQFVYQGHWEKSAEKAGLSLYPALVVGIPFTPVTGPRMLVRPGPDEGFIRETLRRGLGRASRRARALHVLFPHVHDAGWWETRGAFRRMQFQFHWNNAGYRSFEDFLARFRSRRRKDLRRERREVAHLDLQVVDAPGPELLDHLWEAYDDTMRKHGDTDRFLRRAFFEHLGAHFRDRLLAVVARDGERFVGGALDVIKGDALYGRYWGLLEPVRFLHFEVCYHQGIEVCIERGLARFEPGHGGDHKYRRGFEPRLTHSVHQFGHPGVHRAFREAAGRENLWMRDRVATLMEQGPLKPLPGSEPG